MVPLFFRECAVKGRERAACRALLEGLSRDRAARASLEEDAVIVRSGAEARRLRISASLVRRLIAAGLLHEPEPGRFAATDEAPTWLTRDDVPDLAFRAQHGSLAAVPLEPNTSTVVLKNLDESPVAALARRRGATGAPWLSAHAVAAAERLRRDFEVGQLQPRVTANWSASINTGRRAGDGSGPADLTDAALGARMRLQRAIQAIGPELSGVVVDVCCFLKGLELVERERQWPARSAKLVLRLGLESLARHYGLGPSATGSEGNGRTRHWGAEDYRPTIT